MPDAENKQSPEQAVPVHTRFATAMLATFNQPGKKLLKRGHTLEICAHIHGLPNWDTLSSRRSTPPLPWSSATMALDAGLEYYGVPAVDFGKARPLLAILGVHDPLARPDAAQQDAVQSAAAKVPTPTVRRRVPVGPAVNLKLEPEAVPAGRIADLPAEEDLPWPEVVHAPLTRAERRQEERRLEAQERYDLIAADLEEERRTEEDYPDADPWQGRSVRPSREREREGHAYLYAAPAGQDAAPTRRVRTPFALSETLVLRQGEPIDWYTNGEMIDDLRYSVALGELDHCLPGLSEDLEDEFHIESSEDIDALETERVLEMIFSRDPLGMLVRYQATMREQGPEQAGRNRVAWSFGRSTDITRSAALRIVSEDWSDPL